MVSTDFSLNVPPTVSLSGVPEEEQDIFFEHLAQFTLDNLEKSRDTLSELMKGLSGVERNKVAYVKEQTEHFIDQLKKAHKAGILGKVFKALGIVGTVLAGLAAVLCPSPMTIAMFAVALVMTLEPMLADAAGYKSVVETGMGKMMEGFSKIFGNSVGGTVASAIAMTVIIALLTYGTAAGLGAVGTAVGQSTAASMQFLRQIPTVLKNFLTGNLTETQMANTMRLLEAVEASLVIAQGGVKVEQSRLNWDVAKLMYAVQADQALIDLIENLSKSISQDASVYQEHINRLLQYLPQFFAPLNA